MAKGNSSEDKPYAATGDLISIIGGKGFEEDRMGGLSWLFEMPLAMMLLPLSILGETLGLPAHIVRRLTNTTGCRCKIRNTR